MLEMNSKQRALHALCRLNWFFQFTFLFSPEAQFFFVAAQRNNLLDISSQSARGLHLKHCALMIVNLTNFVSASPRWRYRKIESAKKKPRYDSSKINNKKTEKFMSRTVWNYIHALWERYQVRWETQISLLDSLALEQKLSFVWSFT